MIKRTNNRKRKVLTETEDFVDLSLLDASLEDMKEQISVIQTQLQLSGTDDTSVVIMTAYSDMILVLLDKMYNEVL